jgi:hypothetical protein
MVLATHPDAASLSPPLQVGDAMPVGQVARSDGSFHVFDFNHYLDQARTNPLIVGDLDRVWIVGAYLVVGDTLQKHGDTRKGYFDRAPELELIRHVRNGIAHNNHFRIDNLADLAQHPAHNRLAHVRGGSVLEVTAAHQGSQLLFDFAGPADLLDLLMSAEIYLKRMGVGDSLR